MFRFWDISVSLVCNLHIYSTHIWRSMRAMTYRRMLYHFEVIMCLCFSHNTKYVHFEVISFYNSNIKETEISQKRSKGIKNWTITYSVILSVLSNKTNLILGFSSPLRNQKTFSVFLYSYRDTSSWKFGKTSINWSARTRARRENVSVYAISSSPKLPRVFLYNVHNVYNV